VPRVDAALAPKVFTAMHRAISAGRVRACHDLSEGGLAVALAEMCFAGEFGARVSLAALSAQVGAAADPAWLLFGESNTRFVVEVTPENVGSLREAFAGLPLVELGEVTSEPDLVVTDAGGRAGLLVQLGAPGRRPGGRPADAGDRRRQRLRPRHRRAALARQGGDRRPRDAALARSG
jgi:phosphoribosylformylglycinamidine synthase